MTATTFEERFNEQTPEDSQQISSLARRLEKIFAARVLRLLSSNAVFTPRHHAAHLRRLPAPNSILCAGKKFASHAPRQIFLLHVRRGFPSRHEKLFLLVVSAQDAVARTLPAKNHSPAILSRAEDAVIDCRPELFNEDLTQPLRRRLNELTDSGIVSRVVSKGKVFFKKISNPLEDLDADEVQTLYAALKFFRNVSLVGTAGYFLCDSLKNLHEATESAQEIFQFKNNNFARILDDDLLLTMIDAARQRKKISVERESKLPATVTPLAVETDFLCSRQYLVALNVGELMRLRVEKITAVNFVAEDAEKFSSPRKKLREVRLRVTFQNAEERRLREKLLAEELPIKIVDESACEFVCIVEAVDPLQIYPRLWKFQPWAEILSGADGLRERMRRDAEEALKNYAEPV